MLDHITTTLKKGGYTKKELEEVLNTGDVVADLNDIQHVYEVWQNNARFCIYERAYHVISEVVRVDEFITLCKNTDIEDSMKGAMLGKLMNESHYSLRDLFDCSSEELEELTTLARDSGAIGSRLTGAGWGGCCISLV